MASGAKDKLQVLGSYLSKQGYIHEVKSAISEFMQYGIGENELDAMIDYAKSRGALHYKLKDLQVYRRLCEERSRHYYGTFRGV